jgi:putative FmdB family regulatory protein
MPLYEYECSKCGKVFEIIQKFADAPLTTHEECGGEVVRLLSAPAFHLKGSGWYATDYAKTPSGGGGKSEGDGKSDGKQSTDGKKSSDSKSSDSKSSDSKPDTKSSTTDKPSESKPAATTSKND